ncbi:MAG TPA: hypothetical protein VFX39_01315, partial [Gemmatimonadaceae bacterium]|nr:hypothetical protein [Gemmatimonadaceae bacterium]
MRAAAAALVLSIGTLAAVALLPRTAHAQRPVEVELRDAGRGAAARILADVLARPHLAVVATQPTLGLPRDTTFGTTLVVIGADVTVASRVEGDLVVVGGDLFIHPGARIGGRAIAIGGGVYDSFLAQVGGARLAFRDVTYDATPVNGRVLLDQRSLAGADSSVLAWPGAYGLRIPTYDRSNGLSLAAGPRLALPGTGLAVEPALTYRSHLGELDPSARAEWTVGRGIALEALAGRGTYTNDAWARSEVVNSAATLVFGDDERNHYRATRYEGGVRLQRDGDVGSWTARLRARDEDARSVGPVAPSIDGPGVEASSEPWSLFGRDDTTRMLRPNPQVIPGRIVSVIPGLAATWADGDLAATATLGVEFPLENVVEGRFVQTTVDARVSFPALANHRFEGQVHAVLTTRDTAPPQRWSYLGGGSTLPTVEELSMGGDRLFFAEGVYEVPLPRPELPFVGPPTVG